MNGAAFPVLQVSDDSISCFRDEESLRRAVGMTTDKAIKAGFFEKARLIDANLVDYRVVQLELVGKASVFGWMQRGREIKELKLAAEGALELSDVQALVANVIKTSSFWAENEDAEAVISEVQAAKTFSEVTALFG